MSPIILTLDELEHRPQLSKTRSVDTIGLPRLNTNQADPRLSRRNSDRLKDSTPTTVVPPNRSQSSTPRVAMTPISSTIAQPPEAPMDPKPLAKMLQQFSHGILSTNYQINKNDSATRTRQKLSKDDKKFRGRYDNFASLAEARQRDLASAEKKWVRSDMKLLATKQEHRAITGEIAKSLTLGGVNVPSPGYIDDDKTKLDLKSMRAELDRAVASFDKARSEITNLREELDKTKSKHEETTNYLHSAKSGLGQAKAIASTQSSVQKDLAEFRRMQRDWVEYRKTLSERQEKVEDRISSISTQIDKVVAKTASTFAELPNRLEGLEKKIKDQQSAVSRSELDTHSQEIERLQNDYGNLASGLAEQKALLEQEAVDLSGLKEVVSGDADGKNGLLDMITATQSDSAKFQNALKALDETMDEFEESLKETKSKIAGIDKGTAQLDSRLNKLEDSQASNDHMADDISNVRNEMSTFMEKYEIEQNEKDDIVSTDVERLDKELIVQTEKINDLRGQIKTLQTKSLQIKAPAAMAQTSEPPNSDISSLPLTNGASAGKDIDPHVVEELENKHNSIKREVDDLQSNFEQFKTSTTDVTNTHDTFITSLQQRFDNLTTDHMVRCMIHQMQSLYPQHPAHVMNQLGTIQNQFGQLAGNQQHFDQSLRRIHDQLNALEQRLNPEIQTRCGKLESTLAERIDAESRERSDKWSQLIQYLDRRLESSTKEQQSRESEARQTTLADIDKRLNDLTEKHRAQQSEDRETILLDMSQRLKILAEEHQESSKVIKQDLGDHLKRIQSLQLGLKTACTEHSSSINTITKEIEDLKTTVQNQISSSGELENTIEKLQGEVKEMWETVVHNTTCHYLAIKDLNTATGLTHDKLKGGSYSDGDRTPEAPVEVEAEAGPKARSPSMSLGQPSSPLRPPTSSPAEGTPTTGLKVVVGASKAGSGTKEAPLTFSQSTDGADDESEDDVLVRSLGKRKRKPTRKSEESPMRVRKVGRGG